MYTTANLKTDSYQIFRAINSNFSYDYVIPNNLIVYTGTQNVK